MKSIFKRLPKVGLQRYSNIDSFKKTEEKLKASELRFRSLYENSLDAILLTIPDGRVISANSAAERMFGISQQEIKKAGRTGLFVLDEKGIAALEERKRTGKLHAELTYRRKDGSTFEGEVTSSFFTDADGLTKTSMIIRDVTKRKKAEKIIIESEELFSKAFQGNPSALAISRAADGLYVDINAAFLQLSQYSREEVVGHHPKELNLFPDFEERQRFVAHALQGGVVLNREIGLKTKTGKLLRVLYSLQSVSIRGQTHILSAFIDVTQQRQMQKQLEDYSKNLERLVEERTKQLQDKERLAAIGQVAGMVGHDIRNPLQAIVGELYVARESMKQAPPEMVTKEAIESVDFIEQQVDYINKIVADLQDFAKPLKPSFTDEDLCQFIDDALKPVAIPDNIETKLICDRKIPPVKLDKTFMTRVLTNLATNAIQAMPNGGKLTVRASREDKAAIIMVEDTGVGIPDELKSKLFTPMFTTKAKGQGFGLPVVRRLVEAQGGSISFESEVGKGTRFIVKLPLQK